MDISLIRALISPLPENFTFPLPGVSARSIQVRHSPLSSILDNTRPFATSRVDESSARRIVTDPADDWNGFLPPPISRCSLGADTRKRNVWYSSVLNATMSDTRRRRKSDQSCGSDDLSDSYEELNATKETQVSASLEGWIREGRVTPRDPPSSTSTSRDSIFFSPSRACERQGRNLVPRVVREQAVIK